MFGKLNISEILLSPWAGIMGLVIGGIIGFEFQTFAQDIAPFGDIYLALLQMCVLPLIITAVVNSFASLTKSSQGGSFSLKLSLYFFLFMTGAAFFGYLTGLIGGTGYIDEDAKAILGKLFLNYQDQNQIDPAGSKGWGLVNNLIPTNFFQALSQGRTLEVVFFSVLLGLALGLINAPATENVLALFQTSFNAIFIIVKWVLHALPFGIACIIAQQIATTGFETISALFKFVVMFCFVSMAMLVLYTFMMAKATNKSAVEVFGDIQETLLIALGTQSSVAVIPQLIEDLEKNFGLSKEATHLMVPLGMTINRQGVALLFALTGITIAQMYDIALDPFDVLLLILGTSFMAMAAIGPLFSSAPLIAFILEPLGLPTSAGIVFITAAAPILTPFTVMVSAQGVATISTMLFKKKEESTQR